MGSPPNWKEIGAGVVAYDPVHIAKSLLPPGKVAGWLFRRINLIWVSNRSRTAHRQMVASGIDCGISEHSEWQRESAFSRALD